MDNFSLEVLIQNSLRNPLQYTHEETLRNIKVFSSNIIPFGTRLSLNLKLKRTYPLVEHADLHLELRSMFPWYRTGSGGKHG